MTPAERRRLVKVLSDLLDRADRIGGDRDGMPECPWCHADGAGDWHYPHCTLPKARAAVAALVAQRARRKR